MEFILLSLYSGLYDDHNVCYLRFWVLGHYVLPQIFKSYFKRIIVLIIYQQSK